MYTILIKKGFFLYLINVRRLLYYLNSLRYIKNSLISLIRNINAITYKLYKFDK